MASSPDAPSAGLASVLWERGEALYGEILRHPFLDGLRDGSLSDERFSTYVVQDSHYLKGFARALALVAGRAPTDGEVVFFAAAGAEAITVEHELHEGFIDGLGLSARQVAATPRTPTTRAYVDFMLAHAAAGSYADGVAAVLACFWIYREVGRALLGDGSSDERYQRWIDTYGSEEFGAQVDELLAIVDGLGAALTSAERERFGAIWEQGCRYEWMFFDAAWRLERWPV